MPFFILKILRKLRLLNLFSFSYYIENTFAKGPIYIPVKDGIGMEHNELTEQWMIQLLKYIEPHCSVNSKFIDVGANTGQTLLKLKLSGLQLAYVGLEPNLRCVRYLNELISKNKFKDTFILPLAASYFTGFQEIFYYSKNPTDASASMVEGFRNNSVDSDIIPMAPLDALFLNSSAEGAISILKIDVEGFESEVLRGATSIIKKDRPIILIEILPVYNPPNANRLKAQLAIEAMLSEWDYSIYRIVREKDQFVRLLKLNQIGMNSDIEQCEYLFAPSNSNLISENS